MRKFYFILKKKILDKPVLRKKKQDSRFWFIRFRTGKEKSDK